MTYDEARHQKQISRFRDIEAEHGRDSAETFQAHLLMAIADAAIAQMIRNDQSGKGLGLRASGMTEIADVLGY